MAIHTVHTMRYVTADGEEFTDLEKAKEHELKIRLGGIIDEAGIGCGGHWSADMVCDVLWDRRNELRALFREEIAG